MSDEMSVVLTALIIDTEWEEVLRHLDTPLVRAVMHKEDVAAVEVFKRRLSWLRARIPATASYRAYMRGRASAVLNGA